VLEGLVGLLLLAAIAGSVVLGLLGRAELLWTSIPVGAVCALVLIILKRPRARNCRTCGRPMRSRKIDVSAAERNWHERAGARHDYGPDMTYVRASGGMGDQRIYYLAYLCTDCAVYELDEQHRSEHVPDRVGRDRDVARRRHWFLKKSRSGTRERSGKGRRG
ncbi:MAG: hypothetical protein ACYS9X_13170, partial [Planctomycetota bacterium]